MAISRRYFASPSYEFYQTLKISACQIAYQTGLHPIGIPSETLPYHWGMGVHGPSLSYFSKNNPVAFEKDDALEGIDNDNRSSRTYDHAQAEIILYSPCNRDM